MPNVLKLFNDPKKISFLIILTFIITRFFTYFILQIRLSDISYGYHLLDKDLLNYHFFSSLLYLHSQPYLWNLFNGIIVNIFDGQDSSIELFFTLISCSFRIDDAFDSLHHRHVVLNLLHDDGGFWCCFVGLAFYHSCHYPHFS